MQVTLEVSVLEAPLMEPDIYPADMARVIRALLQDRQQLHSLPHPAEVKPGTIADGFWSAAWILLRTEEQMGLQLRSIHRAVQAVEALLSGKQLDPDPAPGAVQLAQWSLQYHEDWGNPRVPAAQAVLELMSARDICWKWSPLPGSASVVYDLISSIRSRLSRALDCSLSALRSALRDKDPGVQAQILTRYIRERLAGAPLEPHAQ